MPPDKRDRSSFGTDVLKLVTGTTGAQLITILASPILTRLYGPDAFGLVSIFTSIAGVIGIIACLRYELAIMLPKVDREAVNLLGLCLLCVVGISGLTVPALYLGGDTLVTFLQAPGLGPYLMLIPALVFVRGIFLALNYWNSRTRHYGRLSIARVTQSVAITITQLGAGFSGYATGGSLISANVVGSLVSTIVLGGQIWRDDHALFGSSISLKEMLRGLERYKRFALIDSWSALLNAVSWQLPAFLLAAFFSPVVVGYYALGLRIIQTPMNLIGGAISQVFFQRASKAFHDGKLAPLVENIFQVLLTLSMFPMLFIAVIGQDLFLVVFGSAWGEAGLYAQILSIWAIIWFISSPLSTIVSVHEKITFGFNLTIIGFITRLLALVIGGVMGSALLAITLFSISGIFTYGLSCYFFLKMAGIPLKNSIRVITGRLYIAAFFIIPVIILQYYISSPFWVVIVSTPIFFSYFLYVYLKDPQLNNFLRNIKNRSHSN